MKKQLLFLLGMLAVTVIMAQTSNIVVNKDGTTETIYQNVLPDYNGPCKCSNPMSANDFNKLLTDIKVKGTDRKMLSFAKNEIRDKCILASQVEEITLLFMFDNSRSAFLGFARKYTYDQGNYYTLRLKYPWQEIENIYGRVNKHDELIGNWGLANDVYLNWLQSSYGSSPILR